MRDIVAALEWVRDNIANFGGDRATSRSSAKSGGGAKVSVLMALPSAKGLFHKAIIQSGPALQMATREDGTKTARQFLAELGLGDKDAAKLRSLPIEQFSRLRTQCRRQFAAPRLPTGGGWASTR